MRGSFFLLCLSDFLVLMWAFFLFFYYYYYFGARFSFSGIMHASSGNMGTEHFFLFRHYFLWVATAAFWGWGGGFFFSNIFSTLHVLD